MTTDSQNGLQLCLVRKPLIWEIVRDIFRTPETLNRTSAYRKVKGILENQIISEGGITGN